VLAHSSSTGPPSSNLLPHSRSAQNGTYLRILAPTSGSSKTICPASTAEQSRGDRCIPLRDAEPFANRGIGHRSTGHIAQARMEVTRSDTLRLVHRARARELRAKGETILDALQFIRVNDVRRLLRISKPTQWRLRRANAYQRLHDHPIRKLFDAGVKLPVNTDDAIVFGVCVSEEFPTSVADASLNTCCEMAGYHLAVRCRPKGSLARA
jgi:adenosine deaminase